jgi:YD repeat-containing protein
VPSAVTDAAQVTYAFTYDSLGRPRTVRRPDGSGTDTRYAYPRVTVTEEFVEKFMANQPTKYEPLAQTVVRRDAFGQIVEVRERTDSGDAVTTYAYDGDGNLRRVDDADGIAVALEHDYLGHRIAIERAERRWVYGYDLNGNMTTMTSPRPAGRSAALYTVSMAYDVLDRPSSRFAGTRAMSATWTTRLQADELAIYVYDGGKHGIGRLSGVGWGRVASRSEPPATSLRSLDSADPLLVNAAADPTTPPIISPTTWTPTRRVSFEYDSQWRVAQETRSFDLRAAGYPFADQRTLLRSYDLLGRATSVTYPDGAAPASSTTTATAYDGHGAPRRLWWQRRARARRRRSWRGSNTTRPAPRSRSARGRSCGPSRATSSGASPAIREPPRAVASIASSGPTSALATPRR